MCVGRVRVSVCVCAVNMQSESLLNVWAMYLWLWLCVCVCVFLWLCVCVCMCVSVNACECKRKYVRAWACQWMCASVPLRCDANVPSEVDIYLLLTRKYTTAAVQPPPHPPSFSLPILTSPFPFYYNKPYELQPCKMRTNCEIRTPLPVLRWLSQSYLYPEMRTPLK
jgi:hypothetical protein